MFFFCLVYISPSLCALSARAIRLRTDQAFRQDRLCNPFHPQTCPSNPLIPPYTPSYLLHLLLLFLHPQPAGRPLGVCVGIKLRTGFKKMSWEGWSIHARRRDCSIIRRAIVSAEDGERFRIAPRAEKEMLSYTLAHAPTLCSRTALSKTVPPPSTTAR